jgi:hypothetical protein
MPLITDAVPILAVIGESHADPLIGAYALDPSSGLPLATSPTAHIPALRAGYFLDPHGRIEPRIVSALCTLRLITYCDSGAPDDVGSHAMERNIFSPEKAFGWRVNPAMKDTPLLFVSGEIDARTVYQLIPPHADVPVPFPASATERIPTFEATAIVSEASITAVVAQRLEPLFRAIALLRSVGFSAIALHSIAPPTADDAQFFRELGHDTRALTRYKVVMLFNAALREHCGQNGFIFIDRWNDFTEGGLVREGYGADAVHVKEAYMRESLDRLYEVTLARRVSVKAA